MLCQKAGQETQNIHQNIGPSPQEGTAVFGRGICKEVCVTLPRSSLFTYFHHYASAFLFFLPPFKNKWVNFERNTTQHFYINKTAAPGEKAKRNKQAVQFSSGSATKHCPCHPDWLLSPWSLWSPLTRRWNIGPHSCLRPLKPWFQCIFSPRKLHGYQSGLCPWEPLGSKNPKTTLKWKDIFVGLSLERFLTNWVSAACSATLLEWHALHGKWLICHSALHCTWLTYQYGDCIIYFHYTKIFRGWESMFTTFPAGDKIDHRNYLWERIYFSSQL